MQNPGDAAPWRGQAQRLSQAVDALGTGPAGAALSAALAALSHDDYLQSEQQAAAALVLAPDCAAGWRLLGLAREGLGGLAGAIEAFEHALALEPRSHDLLADLGRVASALEMHDAAAQLLARALAADPGSAELQDQLAQALRAGHRYGEAIEVLRAAIAADPASAALWNALGSVMLQKGDTDTAIVFFDQALALDPGQAEALYNRGGARLEGGDLDGALADCDAALALCGPQDGAPIRFVRGLAHLCRGELGAGWDDYEARLDPGFPKAPLFDVAAAPWSPRAALEGEALLVLAEQGLGDEIMFAGMIPDVLAALGPQGRLALAVEPRLVELFARSFPRAQVVAHHTVWAQGRPRRSAPGALGPFDLWAPLGSLTRRFRRSPEQFAGATGGYLKPEPAAVAVWRERLEALGPGLKVGVAWTSLKTGGERLKHYAPFSTWLPALQSPDVRPVNLQYGEVDAALAQAAAAGVSLWTPPGLDLTGDLDGTAALMGALDLVIGVGNAATNLAAACGAPTWFINPPYGWPRLGADRYPWFPQAEAFIAERFGDWEPVMARIADRLKLGLTAAIG